MGRLRVVQDGSAPLMSLVGEFDLSTARDVQELLLSLRPQVVLDLEQTTFIDSTTLNTLLVAHRGGVDITISATRRHLRNPLVGRLRRPGASPGGEA
jgi:anti-anti-sigma factor